MEIIIKIKNVSEESWELNPIFIGLIKNKKMLGKFDCLLSQNYFKTIIEKTQSIWKEDRKKKSSSITLFGIPINCEHTISIKIKKEKKEESFYNSFMEQKIKENNLTTKNLEDIKKLQIVIKKSFNTLSMMNSISIFFTGEKKAKDIPEYLFNYLLTKYKIKPGSIIAIM